MYWGGERRMYYVCWFNHRAKIYFISMSTPLLSSDTPEEGIQCHSRWLWATMWVLGTELRTSGRAVCALNRWALYFWVFIVKIYFYEYVCFPCLYMYTPHVCAAHRGQKRLSEPLKLELPCGCCKQPGSSARPTRALNHRGAISLVL